ncbi:MAG: hypothetical protein HFJ51_06550 [Clostridia bacterium]|nr:hypothetical protein [Clostridia bacterium]
MILNPIIPIWAMIIICAILILIVIRSKNNRIKRVTIILLLFIMNLRILIPNRRS